MDFFKLSMSKSKIIFEASYTFYSISFLCSSSIPTQEKSPKIGNETQMTVILIVLFYICYIVFNNFVRKLVYQKVTLKTKKEPSVGLEFIVGQMPLYITSRLLPFYYINQLLL